jgi:hypothetical protein
LINGNYWVEGTEELKPIILDYFSNLFFSEVEATDPAFLQDHLQNVGSTVERYSSRNYLSNAKCLCSGAPYY